MSRRSSNASSQHAHLVELCSARRTPPTHRFDDRWAGRPAVWRRALLATLEQCLGLSPTLAPPRLRIGARPVGLPRGCERLEYETEPGVRTFALLARPARRRGPGVLLIHGHGPDGPGEFFRSDKAGSATIARHFLDRGFPVLAPCLGGFGPRLAGREQLFAERFRDVCNANFFQQMMLGRVAARIHLAELRRAGDVLGMALGKGPRERFVVAGHSLGGRLATLLAGTDSRVCAAILSGCLNSFEERLVRFAACGSQAVPGLLLHADMGELIGLLAPRPTALILGDRDKLCPRANAFAEYRRAQAIFRALGHPSRLRLCEHEGGHRFEVSGALDLLLHEMPWRGPASRRVCPCPPLD